MIYSFIFIIAILLNLLLGLLVLAKDWESHINRIFSLFVFSVISWMLVNYLSNQFDNYGLAFLFNKAIFVVSPYISFSLVLFSIYFPHESFQIKGKHILYLVIPIILSNLLTYFNLTITGITFLENGLTGVEFGIAIYYFGLQFITYIIFALYVLIKKYKTSSKSQKLKMQYLLVGIGLLTIFGTLTNFIIPLLFSSFTSTDFGPLLSLLVFGFTAYAILKHKLLDIKIIATHGLVLAILIFLLSKLIVSQSQSEFFVDLTLFILMLVFGYLLSRSVAREVKHREKLQELTEKLKAMDKQKDEFISMASHELRAPITAIKGYISMIAEGDAGEITEKARGYLTDANAVNERLIRLVNNMLNVSRIEEGRLVYQMEVVNLSRIAKQVFDAFKFEALRKELKFTFNIPDDIKDKVYVDSDRINEIVGNLVSNAVKFTEKGSVSINISQPKKDVVRLEVVDSGPGISKEEQKRLFRKFYRAESTAGKTIGTGLGLYISKLLVETFKGKIGLISKFGEGSTFWFELPLTSKSVGSKIVE